MVSFPCWITAISLLTVLRVSPSQSSPTLLAEEQTFNTLIRSLSPIETQTFEIYYNVSLSSLHLLPYRSRLVSAVLVGSTGSCPQEEQNTHDNVDSGASGSDHRPQPDTAQSNEGSALGTFTPKEEYPVTSDPQTDRAFGGVKMNRWADPKDETKATWHAFLPLEKNIDNEDGKAAAKIAARIGYNVVWHSKQKYYRDQAVAKMMQPNLGMAAKLQVWPNIKYDFYTDWAGQDVLVAALWVPGKGVALSTIPREATREFIAGHLEDAPVWASRTRRLENKDFHAEDGAIFTMLSEHKEDLDGVVENRRFVDGTEMFVWGHVTDKDLFKGGKTKWQGREFWAQYDAKEKPPCLGSIAKQGCWDVLRSLNIHF